MTDEPSTLRKVAWPEVFKGAILLKSVASGNELPSAGAGCLGNCRTTAGWIVIGGLLGNRTIPRWSLESRVQRGGRGNPQGIHYHLHLRSRSN